LLFVFNVEHSNVIYTGRRRVRDRMVVGFTITWTISGYHH